LARLILDLVRFSFFQISLLDKKEFSDSEFHYSKSLGILVLTSSGADDPVNIPSRVTELQSVNTDRFHVYSLKGFISFNF
jgi:hypothetical protein